MAAMPVDEGVAQRLHLLAQLGLECAQQHPDHDGEDHLHIKDLIELELARGRDLIHVDHWDLSPPKPLAPDGVARRATGRYLFCGPAHCFRAHVTARRSAACPDLCNRHASPTACARPYTSH